VVCILLLREVCRDDVGVGAGLEITRSQQLRTARGHVVDECMLDGFTMNVFIDSLHPTEFVLVLNSPVQNNASRCNDPM
jgi:hypothetical protein